MKILVLSPNVHTDHSSFKSFCFLGVSFGDTTWGFIVDWGWTR